MTEIEPAGPDGPERHPAGPSVATADAATFRQVMGHFASGVTVVTTANPQPVGLTVSSFMSVSLEPLLVALCVRNESSTWPEAQAAGGFCVNFLAHDQEALCRTFSSPVADRFVGLGWHASPSGFPIIENALAFVDCRIEAEYEGGDHVLVVGRVTDLGILREDRPLVFYRGGYGPI